MANFGAASETPLVPGDKLERYELLTSLSRGGMANVWIARQLGKHGFEKLVALKTILPELCTELRFQQMFLDEARIASRIEHYNVARILDLGEEREVLFIAMEYVDGDSLSELRRACQRKNMLIPTPIVLRLLADACKGLHEAHELRGEDNRPLDIVHRDISPQNILISPKGAAKVIDFGIAKARDRLAAETNIGVLKGKIQYMPPEQALGGAIDRRADIWALGASLYHLVAGKPPYEAESSIATLHLLASGRPPAPLPPSVPPPLAAIVRTALSMPSWKRFSTAAEMGEAIEEAMIATGATATTADVAAFCAEHLADRAAARKSLVETALSAASSREHAAAQSASSLLVSKSDLSVSLREMSPQAADIPVVPPARARWPWVAAGALMAAIVAAAGGVFGASPWTGSKTAAAKPATATTGEAAEGNPATIDSATPHEATSTQADGPASIPVVDISALPHASDPAANRAPAPVALPLQSAPSKRRKSKTIDDGF